jgi:hypothetical protein
VPQEVRNTARLARLIAGPSLDVKTHGGKGQITADGGHLQAAVEGSSLDLVKDWGEASQL